ncbi:helix-turn-helix transcriptional regulator [Nesterenkonia sandarakina]|uniref:Putative DNA-binding transcriptional regulator YafY n=1 Tax=Nesterenkonia sandarakina TaxID=272918 RepID=A0A7Z0E780_9MICC|nr:WYL domain-containing protein [Nesterenkonia sandarakina]NYJ16365.1 putative DNA-binding transcriptional regulator YafY [Nesterenkonia sandarakina]
MRSARLVALLLELGRTPVATAAQLAAGHRVSVRTIERDIAALQAVGVPLWTRPGPGGGVGLVKGWRSPLTGLTVPELQALIIGEAGSRGLGLETEFQMARLKMLAATATTGQSAAVLPAQERFLLDHEAWFTEPERPEALPAVAQAVWSGHRLRIRYQRGAGGAVTRVVDPLGLVLKGEHWYLVAAHRRSARTYRVSRMRRAEELPEAAWRPEGFSLAQHWRDSRAEFEAALHAVPVQVSVPITAVDSLRAATPGAPMRGLKASSDGTTVGAGSAGATPADATTAVGEAAKPLRVGFELRLESLEVAASQLIAVPGVEVLSPDALRHMVLARAEELVARHRRAAGARRHPG